MGNFHAWMMLTAAGFILVEGTLGLLDLRFLGCFQDHGRFGGGRALQHEAPDFGDIEPCVQYCISQHYRFAGVESGDECFCGNDTYSRHGARSGECTDPCENNPALLCGGDWKLAVYRAECSSGYFGLKCSSRCHCHDGVPCKPEDGRCPNYKCAAGWQGHNCSIGCSSGTFGPSCQFQCHCAGGAPCVNITGMCPEEKCAPGWMGKNCSLECAPGWFGDNCSSSCHCTGGAPCDPVNGTCALECAVGWRGDNCSLECAPGWFGENCSSSCHCTGGAPCHPVYGTCEVQCADGWRGNNCSLVMGESPISGTIGGAAAGVGCLLLLLLLVVILVIILRKRRQKHVYEEAISLNSLDMADTFELQNEAVYSNANVAKPIKLQDLHHVIQQERAKEKPFEEECKELPRNQQALWTAGEQVGQRQKQINRFKNILPYDHSRVVLSQIPGDPTSDYINASHIKGYTSTQHFIAAQGPTPRTLIAFWRMIWEQQVPLVVMLTKLVEGKTNKCTQYWPMKDHQKFGEVDVKLVSTQVWPDFTLRRMTLIKKSETRNVAQFHFRGWPDHGVPQHATALLNFRHKVCRELQTRSSTGPVVVHCSAGVGRTGAYLAVDYLLQQAELEQEVDVCTCVNLMRADRVNMVQTREQYAFVYTAVLEALFVGVTLIPCFEFPDVYSQMLTPDVYSSSSKLEQQYQLLESMKPKSLADKTGSKGEKRPLSEAVSSRAESLQAVFVNGRSECEKFIATQSPSSDQVEEFWRVVFECKSSCIVMLDAQNLPDYWPPEGEAGCHGDLSVTIQSCETSGESIVIRHLILQHTKDKSSHTVKQVQFTCWPVDGGSGPVPISQLFSIREAVSRYAGKGPITVHCGDGVSCTGLYLAASNLCDMISVEQELDVFQVVQALRTSKPDFITSQIQYRYLYEVAREYMDTFSDYANFQ